MAKSMEKWDDVYQAFLPDERLFGQRSRDLYCEREHSPMEAMRARFRPIRGLRRLPIGYLTGPRGCGKSTLLLRFLESFRDDYFVVYFDVEYNLDTQRAHEVDLLYLLGTTIFQVAVQEGLRPEKSHVEHLSQSIRSLTETATIQPKDESVNIVELAAQLICLGSGAFGGSLAERTAEKLTKSLTSSFKLSSGASQEIVAKNESEPKVQSIINAVNFILADVQERADKEVLVVVDGLDKLRQPGQAQRIFLETNALHGPRCRIVYTVPMSIYTDLTFGDAEEECPSYLLPNVKIYEKSSSSKKYRNGYQMMREVVHRRLSSIGLAERDLLTKGTLDLLILKSGGGLRWLIELIHDASNLAWSRGFDKLNRPVAREAIIAHARKLGSRLDSQALAELNKIRKNKVLAGGPKTGQLLQSRLIVPYFNGDPWFDVHPLVWQMLDNE